MSSAPEPTGLLIADISGYTAYARSIEGRHPEPDVPAPGRGGPIAGLPAR